MPAYDYRCRTCDASFEVRRAIREERGAATCPQGHPDTTRIFAAVAVGGRSAGPAPAAGGADSAGGGCCGGGCCG